MRSILIFFSLLLSILPAVASEPPHDVPIAIFQLTDQEGGWLLDVNFDLHDFCTVNEVASSAITVPLLEQYLQDYTEWSFGGNIATLEVQEVTISNHHLKVKADLSCINARFRLLTVKLDCLNEIRGHTNALQLDIRGESRDFRLHKDRVSISTIYR